MITIKLTDPFMGDNSKVGNRAGNYAYRTALSNEWVIQYKEPHTIFHDFCEYAGPFRVEVESG